MRRYIWLGDSKYGGSVYWDKKREIAVKNINSKSSAQKSKFSTRSCIGMFLIIVILRIITFFLNFDKISDDINIFSMIVCTLFFTTVMTSFIYHAMYGNHNDYKETTIEDAIFAIRSTGYLNSPYVFMAVDKKFNNILITLIILVTGYGLSQIISELNILENIIRVPVMILFIATPVYMVYLVDFKKGNRLKL